MKCKICKGEGETPTQEEFKNNSVCGQSCYEVVTKLFRPNGALAVVETRSLYFLRGLVTNVSGERLRGLIDAEIDDMLEAEIK